MGDVFISYARADQAVARKVAKALTDKGYSVWWDADLPAHKAYSEIIEQHLRDAKAVVVLWSTAAAASQWVRAEADYARNNNKLAQAQVDGNMPPLPFNQIQCADLRGWHGSTRHAGWAKLLGSVDALVSGEEQAASIPPNFGWRDRFNTRWLAAAAVVFLVAAVVGFFLLRNGDDEKRPVLAVLPFESLDQRDASLVSGIWEDTRQALGRNPQLLVLGPNTAEEIAEKGGETARKLADYLVEASVRSVGDRVRVNANLVRTEDGAEVWNKSFDRKLDDVFALQSEIAGEIEGHIRGRLAERGGIKPENIATSGEVYALYSDARAKIRRREMGTYDEAKRQLEQVVRMDPNFAPGWATLAVSKAFGSVVSSDKGSAEANARRAIALAPNLAAGHAALGFILQKGPVAQAALRRALALDPNDYEAINWLANSLDNSTQAAEKLRLYSRVAEIEPLWWPAILNKFNLLRDTGDIKAMEGELARVRAQGDPTMTAAIEAYHLENLGDLSGAITVSLNRYRQATPQQRRLIGGFLWGALMKLGLYDAADKIQEPATEFVPYLRRNDPKALEMIEARMGPRQYWSFQMLPIIGTRVYIYNHREAKVVELYRAVAKSPEEFEGQVSSGHFLDVAPSLAIALQRSGDPAEAERLLDLALARATEQNGSTMAGKVQLARIHAARGNANEAVKLLGDAVRRNWLPELPMLPMDLAEDPALAELKSNPRFEAIRQQILGHIRKERAELGPIRLD
ncbi:TIR domain-containing protein [Sphingomonas lutea]|uniref:TIR domain-containing protein n=1 Tax=Sphingomonas lutea TaxID=1045317 RepID=A0A7G9SJU4_9SPHN|nr:TIR domain-containing protein [Sphingomonas lutea]QNN68119.1 TIR domain-containing protein [Sphingomonas lutea]